MGVYNKNGIFNKRPFYINDNNHAYLFYSKRGAWKIGDKLGGFGSIKTTETGLNEIPLGAGNWEYYNWEAWTSDPNITVSKHGRYKIIL